ncbi:MAG TPA: glycosyltransferase [Candidatus Saccharimonadales bacterium]|nr:glycosyltransferase [Candidatus Saccharimonadales bacterium]
MDRTRRTPYTRIATIVLFIILTGIGLAFSVYLFYSVHSFYMYLIAASFTILTIVSGFFNISTSYFYYRSYLYDAYIGNINKQLRPLSGLPTVAIAMPVYNEDPALVEKNMARLKEMDYPKEKMKFYILDDSTDRLINSRLSEFSRKSGIRYLHRADRKGFKAGALNNMMKVSREQFLAIFDYDEYLSDTRFLLETLPYFQDDRLSYVQTEKKYSKGTFFSDTIDLFDAFFFKFIQPARALNNTAIFAGSCGIIRSSYLRKIGGFPEYIIEDTFFSFESDSKGYKSLYLPKVFALGKPINTFTELVQQQWRYNYGDNQFLGYLLRRFKSSNNKRKFSGLSYVDYMTHGFGLNYISVVLLMFTVVSVLIVFSQFAISNIPITSIFTSSDLNFYLELLGVSAFSLSVLTPVVLTKIHFKSVKKGFMIFILNFALVFIRAKAALSAMFSKNYKSLWDGNQSRKPTGKFLYAVRNSIFEIIFSISLFVFSGLALWIDNLSGGLWLLWYGILYVSTFYMFYRYG